MQAAFEPPDEMIIILSLHTDIETSWYFIV